MVNSEILKRYDTADYLKSEEDIIVDQEAVIDEGDDDPAYIVREFWRGCPRAI